MLADLIEVLYKMLPSDINRFIQSVLNVTAVE